MEIHRIERRVSNQEGFGEKVDWHAWPPDLGTPNRGRKGTGLRQDELVVRKGSNGHRGRSYIGGHSGKSIVSEVRAGFKRMRTRSGFEPRAAISNQICRYQLDLAVGPMNLGLYTAISRAPGIGWGQACGQQGNSD